MPALDRARATALSTLTDRCRIVREGTGEPVLDRDTGQTTRSGETVVYEDVACSVTAARGRNADEEVYGDEDVAEVDVVIRLPWDATGVRKGDTIEVTAAENLDLVGSIFDVERSDLRTRRASTMLPCSTRQEAS